ncbi:hypothetical protein ACUR5C_04545 [Aliikangiella sp. IMCC44653]
MKLGILIGVLLMVASCSTGPTEEQKQRWAQLEAQRVKNTEDLVDMFVSEVWNKRADQIYQDRNCHNHGLNRFWCGHKQLSKPLHYTSQMSSEYKNCNPTDWARKNLAIAGAGRYDFNIKKYSLSSKLTYDFTRAVRVRGKKTCLGPSKIGDFPGLTDAYNPNIRTPSLDAHAIRKRLVEKGVPLYYCFEERWAIENYDKRNTNTQRLRCSISMGKPFGGPMGIFPMLDFYFETKNGNIIRFEMDKLHLTPEETTKTFAQVFNARFKEPQYEDKVRDYVAAVKAYIQRRYAKQMAQYRAQDEYYRKQEQKREAEISRLRMKAFSQSLQQTANELKNFTVQQPPRVASSSLPAKDSESSKRSTQVSTKAVRKCSAADKNCNPEPYVLCEHKKKTYSCHKYPIEYTAGMWRSKAPNTARVCMYIFGNDKEAVWQEAFSRTHLFSSGRDSTSPDPKNLCLDRCEEYAQKYKKVCTGMK